MKKSEEEEKILKIFTKKYKINTNKKHKKYK